MWGSGPMDSHRDKESSHTQMETIMMVNNIIIMLLYVLLCVLCNVYLFKWLYGVFMCCMSGDMVYMGGLVDSHRDKESSHSQMQTIMMVYYIILYILYCLLCLLYGVY